MISSRWKMFCVVAWAALGSIPAFGQVSHPMDPLEDVEIISAAQILLDAGAAAPGSVFQSIELREPSKEDVLAWETGDPIPRSATVFFRQPNKTSYKTTVDLVNETYTTPVKIKNKDGQLGLTIQEIIDFSFAFEDPSFLAALAARGIDTPEELANVFVTPLTAGAFGLAEEEHRIVKAQMYDISGAGINLYAKPIEGVQAIMDLDDREVLQVIDSGVVPMPTATAEFDEATVKTTYGLRPKLKPVKITQPQGTNFTVNGNFVDWQKWRFHVRFDRRVGPVLSLVTYDGRSIMYQGTLSEIFVPYQDPNTNWYYRMFMDAGEFGFGALASPLDLGLDLPQNAVLLNAVISAAIPDPDLPVIPLPLDHVVGIFERPTGNPIWRHAEFFSGQYEGRAGVELVVRSIAQVGNYDYIVDWVFDQAGGIRVDVGLTGIVSPKVVNASHMSDPTAAQDTAYGTLVAPKLSATNHSHFFNFRLDLDVDGRDNSFIEGHLEETSVYGSPRQSVWTVHEHEVESEDDGKLNAHDSIWKVINPSRTNVMGYNTGYTLHSHGHGGTLLDEDDFKRARFIKHQLWLTAYDPDELYASGDTPNQNSGKPGLPKYINDDEGLTDTDIVLWHTVSHHHAPRAEDWPVMPVEWLSFELRPENFFDRNPSLDLRRAPFEAP